MKTSSAILCIVLVIMTLGSTTSGEVHKDFVIKNWWNRFLLWLVSRFQDKYDGQLSICSLSLYPPFEDIDLLELMLSMRFGQQNRRKGLKPVLPSMKIPGVPAVPGPRSKRFSPFEDLTSIVEDPVEDLEDEVAAQPVDALKTEPIVRILPSGRVCFGVHELSHRVPKEAAKRRDFLTIINSFITYLNHQNKYPTKVDQIEI